MLQVSKCKCQLRREDDGHIITLRKGDVVEYAGKHAHLQPMDSEDYQLDFTTATEDELLNSKWTVKEARAAIKKTFGITLKSGSRRKMVAQILDARYRNDPIKDED